MILSGDTDNIVINNIFSGCYVESIRRGIRPHLFEFSSPSYPISSFTPPYDAVLKTNTGYFDTTVAAGRRLNPKSPSYSSNRSGILYYYDNADIYGVCHGFGHDDQTYAKGFNFYNATYQAGYFAPPFGENIQIIKSNQEGNNAVNMGTCYSLNVTEYNELFGIVSQDKGGNYLIISSPKEVCPEDATDFYFQEIQYSLIPGTTTQLGSTTFYNGNQTPTSLDNYEIKVDARYLITGDIDNNYIEFSGGRPIASYSADSQQNKLNNTLCEAQLLETDTSIGAGTNGIQLAIAPDILFGAIGDQVSFIGADPFYLWHFQYQENTETFPFFNNFEAVDPTKGVHLQSSNEGTQLFNSILSTPQSYWQNRQCEDTVDFLPWTYGGAIYACPSYHFDIPFYAATKKFGFYGTRFLNSCSSLALNYSLSGVKDATELPQSDASYVLDAGVVEPDGIDKYGGGGFGEYANLLKIANVEEAYSNMYALNKGFFIWANSPFVTASTGYQTLLNEYPAFGSIFSGFIAPFNIAFGTTLSGYTGNAPRITLSGGLLVDTGNPSPLLFNNNEYIVFKNNLKSVITGTDGSIWDGIENSFGYYISDGTSINENYYQTMVAGREQRLLTRYLDNITYGRPIDLYPLNQITFSLDTANDYLTSTGWSRSTTSVGKNSPLDGINRRYFAGAYGNAGSISGLMDVLNTISFSSTTSYYPGFFNDTTLSNDTAAVNYIAIVSGDIRDEKNRSFSPSGWLAMGYNEIGKLDGNFSCFTPIFVQHPLPEVYCKIGQMPSFSTYAVDYHSIPEDKISVKYPEIFYWAYNLKILDGNYNNLYPLTYQWLRVPITGYDNFVQKGDFSMTEPSNPTGNWACLEGSGQTCTVFHPLESFPLFSGVNPSENYTFLKGAKKGIDDQYYYFCLASGRFGIRMSDPSSLVIEDWARFDVSLKNGMNTSAQMQINFDLTDYNGTPQTVTFTSDSSINYAGYQRDIYAIPETEVQQKIPPPNAGYGDVTAWRFVGPLKYIGVTRSYTPSNLNDTIGLRESWGRFLDYGALIPFSKQLSQLEGDLLYGYSHLPICEDYKMGNGKAGIKTTASVNGYNVTHWTLGQKAVASFNSAGFGNLGMKWDSLNNIGGLYPPINNDTRNWMTEINYDMGVGHWQWGNNLGAIKRFGQLSNINAQGVSDDIIMIGNSAPTSNLGIANAITSIQDLLVKPETLAGVNCGYTPYGMGRNMIYYIEAFDRFYLYCDPVKKKNVKNVSYMNPGIRQHNSAIQYFWLGHPNNVQLQRKTMYGPYAYQWKTLRHNRDRNGNGISEGFYSMGWAERYSLMYDAPAVYGLYTRNTDSPSFVSQVNNINALRSQIGITDLVGLRSNWFGTTQGEGDGIRYGNTNFTCDTDNPLCDYVSASTSLGGSPNFRDYNCPQDVLNKGQCFDPCISIRYGQGFFPGGKAQSMFGTDSPNKEIRMVPMANINNSNGIIINDEQSSVDKNIFFRSPVNTPHARVMRGLSSIPGVNINSNKIVGVAACQDGGADHCNYITPTVHLGTSCFLEGETTAFLAQVASMESIIGNSSS